MPSNLRPYLVLDARPAAALGIGATSNVDFIATCPMQIADAHCAPSVGNAGSTARVLKDALGNGIFVAISAALVWAVAGDVVRAAALGTTLASRTVTPTDVIRSEFIDGGGGGGANGNLYAHFVLTPVVGA